MARGGKRSGTPGTPYPNRSDLRSPKVPAIPNTGPSASYGESARLQAAQRAVPSGPPPGQAPGPGGPAQAGAEIPQTNRAGAAGSFLRPTERPDEVMTSGIASGPGAGPTPGAPMRPGEDVLPQLQAMYAAFPSEGLREMLEDIVSGNG